MNVKFKNSMADAMDVNVSLEYPYNSAEKEILIQIVRNLLREEVNELVNPGESITAREFRISVSRLSEELGDMLDTDEVKSVKIACSELNISATMEP